MADADDQVSGVAGRYASALFELAEEQGQTDAVMAALDRFSAALDESADLRRLVRSPVFRAEEQDKALVALLPKLGVDGIAANLIRLLARNRRLFAVAAVIKAYAALLAQKRGEATAEIISAEPLSDAQTAALKAALEGRTGKEIRLSRAVDPSLIGGLVVKLGSRMIDTSLKTKLSRLRIALKEVR